MTAVASPQLLLRFPSTQFSRLSFRGAPKAPSLRSGPGMTAESWRKATGNRSRKRSPYSPFASLHLDLGVGDDLRILRHLAGDVCGELRGVGADRVEAHGAQALLD